MRAEQYDLSLGWIIATVLGALAIGLVPETIGLWRMLVPVAAMMVYVLFAYTRSLHSTPKVADSVYFMGFLWTLFALIVTLLQHRTLTAATLFTAFGYALITTAAGMFTRLCLMQFYRSLEDQEVEAFDQLDEQVSGLVATMERASQSVSTKCTQLFSTYGDHLAQTLSSATSKMQSVTDGLSVNAEALALATALAQQSISEATRQLSILEKRMVNSSQRISEAVVSASERMEKSIEGLSSKVAAFQDPVATLQAEIHNLGNGISTALSSLRESAVRAVTSVSDAVDAIRQQQITIPLENEIEAAARRAVESLNSAATACELLSQHANRSICAMVDLDTIGVNALERLSSAKKHVDEIHQKVQSIAERIGGAEAQAQQFGVTVKDAVRFVQSSLTDL